MIKKKRNPFFTIAITTYNRAQLLKLAIESVLKQSFDDYEILVLDNASIDDTQEVVKIYQLRSNKIRYIRQPYNVGHPKNYSRCFYEARGKYLFTLSDDDMILKKDTLYELHQYINQFNYPGFIKIGAIFYHQSVKNIIKGITFKQKVEIIKPDDKNFVIKSYNNGLEFVSGCIFKINKRFFKYLLVKDKLYLTLELIYKLIYQYGALFIGDHYILARYAHEYDLNSLVKPYFSTETLLRINKKYSFDQKMAKILDIEVRRKFLWHTCNFKLYISNRNLLYSFFRILKDDKNIILNFRYYLFGVIVLITPRLFLRLFKKIYYYKLTKAVKDYVAENNLSRFLMEKEIYPR